MLSILPNLFIIRIVKKTDYYFFTYISDIMEKKWKRKYMMSSSRRQSFNFLFFFRLSNAGSFIETRWIAVSHRHEGILHSHFALESVALEALHAWVL